MDNLQPQDRVVVSHEGKMIKGRVADIVGDLYFITFNKYDPPVAFNKDEVFGLYRWSTGQNMLGVPISVLVPLFPIGGVGGSEEVTS